MIINNPIVNSFNQIRVYDPTYVGVVAGQQMLGLIGSGNAIPISGARPTTLMLSTNWQKNVSSGTEFLYGLYNDTGYYNSVLSGGNVYVIGIYNHTHNKFSTKSGGTSLMYGIYNHLEYNMQVDSAISLYSLVAADSTVSGTIPLIEAIKGVAQIGHYTNYTKAVAVNATISSASGNTTTTDLAVCLQSVFSQALNADITLTEVRGLSIADWSGNLANPVGTAIGIYIDDTVKNNATDHYAIRSVSTSPSTFAGDVEVTDSGKGVILKSPNGTRWRISVSNAGAISATSVEYYD